MWHCAGHMMALQISGHLSQITVYSWQGTVLPRALNEEPKTPASLDAEMGEDAVVSELRMLAGAGWASHGLAGHCSKKAFPVSCLETEDGEMGQGVEAVYEIWSG